MRPLCQCGCGATVNLATMNHTKNGYVKGQPMRFLRGHAIQRKGAAHEWWKGGVEHTRGGYIKLLRPDHPREHRGYVYEHILVAEHALGRFLPPKAVVHHVNGDTGDNANTNLVICQDNTYHLLLHKRQRAYEASGHVDWRLCQYCKSYDDPANMYDHPTRTSAYHRACLRAARQAALAAAKENQP